MFYKLIIPTALIIACAPQQISRNKTPSYVKIAAEKFQNDVNYVFNSEKSYVLCVQQLKPSHKVLYPPLAFLIYDLRNEKVVYQESLNNGSVKWVSDTKIRVSLIPGVVSGQEEIDSKARGFVYDLALNKKLYESIEDRR